MQRPENQVEDLTRALMGRYEHRSTAAHGALFSIELPIHPRDGGTWKANLGVRHCAEQTGEHSTTATSGHVQRDVRGIHADPEQPQMHRR